MWCLSDVAAEPFSYIYLFSSLENWTSVFCVQIKQSKSTFRLGFDHSCCGHFWTLCLCLRIDRISGSDSILSLPNWDKVRLQAVCEKAQTALISIRSVAHPNSPSVFRVGVIKSKIEMRHAVSDSKNGGRLCYRSEIKRSSKSPSAISAFRSDLRTHQVLIIWFFFLFATDSLQPGTTVKPFAAAGSTPGSVPLCIRHHPLPDLLRAEMSLDSTQQGGPSLSSGRSSCGDRHGLMAVFFSVPIMAWVLQFRRRVGRWG
jgi:hypothetical protein